MDSAPVSSPQQDYPPAPIERTKSPSPPPKITKAVDTKPKDVPEISKKKHVSKPTPAPVKAMYVKKHSYKKNVLSNYLCLIRSAKEKIEQLKNDIKNISRRDDDDQAPQDDKKEKVSLLQQEREKYQKSGKVIVGKGRKAKTNNGDDVSKEQGRIQMEPNRSLLGFCKTDGLPEQDLRRQRSGPFGQEALCPL